MPREEMITLFCNEEQKTEERDFWRVFWFHSLVSLFLSLWQKVCFRASLVFAWHLFSMHFFSFFSLLSSLAIIDQDNSSLLFVLSRVYYIHTLY